MKKIGILNGPNLDRLGKREPAIYGSTTLQQLAEQLKVEAKSLNVELDFFQSNSEGALIDQVASWVDSGFSALIANPGGLTHTSVALRDSFAGSALPIVEVHISNIYKREDFRHSSLTAGVSIGVISGLGLEGYFAALRYLMQSETLT